MKKEGILIFPGFLNKIGIKQVQNEANELKSKAFKSSSEYNVYVLPTDPNFPSDSARNRTMKTSKKCIPNDLIPIDSPLIQIYNSKKVRSFFLKY